MDAFFGLVGLFGSIISLIILIIFAVKKRPLKVISIVFAIFVISFIVGLALPSPEREIVAIPDEEIEVVEEAEEVVVEPEPAPEPEVTTLKTGDTGQSADPVSLKLAVWDAPDNSLSNAVEVWTKGLGSWYPDLQFGGDNTVIGPYERGDEVEVCFYPDGRDSTEIRFVLIIGGEMISESDRDMVRIELYDDRVEVFSTGLPDMGATFLR